MRLTFLGTGASSLRYGESNMLLQIGESSPHLLVDAGTEIMRALHDAKVSLTDVGGLVVTHLHPDHAGGVPSLSLTTQFRPCFRGKPKLKLYVHESLVNGLEAMIRFSCALPNKIATLADFYDVQIVDESFEWQGTRLLMIPTKHCLDNGVWMPCFGLSWLGSNHSKVWLSGDTTLYDQPYYSDSDTIFHDCETRIEPTSVHARFEQLCTLPPEVKARMWLYHFNDEPKPNCKAHGFAGWAAKRQVFEL